MTVPACPWFSDSVKSQGSLASYLMESQQEYRVGDIVHDILSEYK